MHIPSLPNKKSSRPFRIWIQCIIWLSAVCAIAFVLHQKITPLYSQELLNSVQPSATPELKPGESVSQSFRSDYEYLHNAGVAISYRDDIPENTTALIQVLTGDELIVEQPLTLWYFPTNTFCPLGTDLPDCQGKTITIRVENISPESDDAVFSLLATDREYLYPANTDDYQLNGTPQRGRLLFTASYITGYSYYHALTYAFWIFLAALILSGLAAKQSFSRNKASD